MILFFSVIVLGAFMWRVASRTATLEQTVAQLVARVSVMEHLRAPVVHPPIQESTREPVRDPTGDPIREPARELSRPFIPRATAVPTAGVAEPQRPTPVTRSPGLPVSAAGSESLETRIGSRWLLYIGVIAIVVGVGYFEKLAIDSHWIGETARVVQGGVVGVLFVLGGLSLVRKGFPLYGQMICGGGVAVLYVSTYAAFNFYHLIGRPPAMALMCGVTAAGVWLADRQRSQGLAVLAVGGGFATPFLLSAAADAQLALFGYETVLIAGTMYLAHRRAWPTLNVVSYGLAVLTIYWWAVRFYTSSKYLPTELFLTMFCAMYLYILHESRRSKQPLAEVSRAVLWTGPPFYYLASLVILADHSLSMLVYLLALTLTGAMAGLRIRPDARRASAVRLLFWFAAAVPLLYWIGMHPARVWLTAGLAAVAGVYIIHLVAHLEATAGDDRPLNHADLALLHLNGLASFGGAYLMISPVHHGWSAPVAAALALWHGAIAFALAKRQREHALHFAALAFSLTMIAIGLQFDGAWVTMGWAAEGAAVTALGLRTNRSWLRTGGLALFAIAVARLVGLQFAAPSSGQLVLLNERSASGIFVIALTYWLAWIHQRNGRPESQRKEVAIALACASLLTLSLISSEIDAFWVVRGVPGGSSRAVAFDGHLAREMMLSMTWAGYATALVIAGIRKRYAPIRYLAFAIFGVTIVKVFAIDLAELDRVYRVSSIIGLGVMLLVTSYLYHRFKGRLAAVQDAA